MNEGKNAMEVVWGRIKLNELNISNRPGRFQFTSQQVSEETGGHGENPHILDALWQLVIAGILIPAGSLTQFELSSWGEEVIKQDISPYQKHKFLAEIQGLAPRLEPDSLAYIALGLDCMHGIATATIALTRVALEIELDSVIEAFIQSKNPSNTTQRKLSSRYIATRAEALLDQLRTRDLIPEEEIKLFEAYVNQIRILGNRILHPKDGVPLVDPMIVQSVMYSFRSFASIASNLKAEWGHSG
jgi:hypothetical protein